MLTYIILRGFYVEREFQDGASVMPAGLGLLQLDSEAQPPSMFLNPNKALHLRKVKQYEKRGLLTLTPPYYVYTACSSSMSEVQDFADETRRVIRELVDLFIADRRALRRKLALKYTPHPSLSLRELMIAHIVQSTLPEGKKLLSPCSVGVTGSLEVGPTLHTVSCWSVPPKKEGGWQAYMEQHDETIPIVTRMVEVWMNNRKSAS